MNYLDDKNLREFTRESLSEQQKHWYSSTDKNRHINALSYRLHRVLSLKHIWLITSLYNCVCCKTIFSKVHFFTSVQFISVAQLCPTLCDPVNCSTPGLPVHHQLPEFTQTHFHRVRDAIQPTHPLSSPSPPAPNPSQLETPKTEPHRENYTQVSRRKTCYIQMDFLQYFEETFNLFQSLPSNPIL